MSPYEVRNYEPSPLTPTVELFRLSLGIGRPPGECRLVRRDDGSIHIKQADPKIWLPDTFLKTLVGPQQNNNQWVHLNWQSLDQCDPETCCQTFKQGRCYYGALLTIRDRDRTVIYRIGRYLRGEVWEARIA